MRIWKGGLVNFYFRWLLVCFGRSPTFFLEAAMEWNEAEL